MPTDLGPRFPPDYQGIPTHMSTEDFRIWLRYRDRLKTRARALYFDVRLGADEALTAASGTGFENMWFALNAKRADVVSDEAAGPRLIELRDNAQTNAIGRLLTYKLLWERDPGLPGPLTLELATNVLDADVAAACQLYGILYTHI